ncbi:hypothetical protein AM469_006509, partial [Pseudomonas aeruginosa]
TTTASSATSQPRLSNECRSVAADSGAARTCCCGSPPKRAIAGLVGILIAAMMAGLNNRVGALALADVRGALGFGLDDASWLTTVYSAGEVIAMPFSHGSPSPSRCADSSCG